MQPIADPRRNEPKNYFSSYNFANILTKEYVSKIENGMRNFHHSEGLWRRWICVDNSKDQIDVNIYN